MLATQEYIKTHGLPKLIEDFVLHATYHETLPLVSLKYDQKDSPKYHEITRECRSLILELNSWNVIARSFRRFYNFNEYLDETFDWNFYYIQEKVDGSLILLFHYADNWHIATSGSFAKGIICSEYSHTWESLFFECVCKEKIASLNPANTYIFELCSIFNKVVVTHNEPHVVLLSGFENESCEELGITYMDFVAEKLGVRRPLNYTFETLDEAIKWKDSQPGSFEGFIFVDKNLNRVKCKNPQYLALHRLKGNNNLFLKKHILPIVLNMPEEKGELLAYFPEITEKWDNLEGVLTQIFKDADEIHNLYPDYSQKQFALAIKGEPWYLQNILFTCRKNQTLPSTVKNLFEDLLVKHLT